MAIYCMSDIHGEYDKYAQMIELIELSDDDTLYVLGDVIDRGLGSIDILMDMMRRPNVIPLIGNHEYMALSCLRILSQEITEESIAELSEDVITGFLEWQNVGGQITIDEFHRLCYTDKQDVIAYLGEFELYKEVECGGKTYVLVHAGLDNFAADRPLDDYDLHEMIFNVPDYFLTYYPDKYLVTGHSPTFNIDDNPNPGKIYRANNHIAIDCGSGFGGQLGCICLDTGEEYYV